MFNAYDEEGFTAAVAWGGNVLRNCVEDAFCGVVAVVVNGLGTGSRKDGDSAIVRLETAFDMQGNPRACLLFFSDATGVFSSVPECRSVEFAGQCSTNVRADES